MGSSYQPLLSKTQDTNTSSATTPSRSRSLPTSLVHASNIKKEHFNQTPTVDEVDDATPFLRTIQSKFDGQPKKNDDKEKKDDNNGKRKLGVFLNGAVAGSIAAGVWTYGDLTKESLQAATEISEIVEAELFHENQEKTTIITPTRRERFNFIADVVAETGSALVYIEVKDLHVHEFVRGEPVRASNGSGFIVKEDGLILTNAHVVTDNHRLAIQVKLQDGRCFAGQVEDVDHKSDLATIRIDCRNLPVMKLGQSSTLRPGEFVVAMGSPLALSNTITTGVVSSVARNKQELVGLKGLDGIPEYIQTDAAITFGNSGGPLINLDGEAIGINSMKVTPGISFAIPIDYAKEFLQKSQEKEGLFKKKHRRFMGVTMLAVTPQTIPQLKQKIGLPKNLEHGIVVYQVVQESPADKAGIETRDVITHINGVEIYDTGNVYELLETPEDLHVTLIRDNVQKLVTVRPDF